jgi:tRNA (guanine9-N1)-methyltransferase
MEPAKSKKEMKIIRRKEHWEKKKQEKKLKKKKNKPKLNCLYRNNRAEWDLRKSRGLRIVIDCGFDSELTEKERTSLRQQLMYSHAVNKRSETPIQLIATSVSESLQQELSKISWDKWSIDLIKESYIEKYPKEQLVYLTADSGIELDSFDENMVYIVGGLVDHNRLKMITFDKANQQGIQTARLPLSKYVKLESSAVLTVNHVISLIVKYHETKDWAVSINSSIPIRKITKITEN